MFIRRSWRQRPRLLQTLLETAEWGSCPACDQVRHGEYLGRVVVQGADANRKALERRIANVARRAGFTQPERRIVSMDWAGPSLEVLTTSQKLAHRIATELRKAFGGRTTYEWSASDGSLLATWARAGSRAR